MCQRLLIAHQVKEAHNMMWIIQHSSIQLLLALWIIQLIYTAYATVKTKLHDGIKAGVIILLFAITYITVDVSKNWLGTPSFTDDEVVGILDGFDKFTVENKPMFAIMATTKTGPFMFVIPWEPKTETDLKASMNRRATTGQQTVIRKKASNQIDVGKSTSGGKPGTGKLGGKGGPESGFDSGETELYDFTDQVLIPKADLDNK